MKIFEIQKGGTSLDGLRPAERPDPQPGPREVVIRVRATSINYRDQMIVTGNYFGGPVSRNLSRCRMVPAKSPPSARASLASNPATAWPAPFSKAGSRAP